MTAALLVSRIIPAGRGHVRDLRGRDLPPLTRLAAMLSLLSMAACGGTALEFAGPLCGGVQPATFRLADQKDRAGFDAKCTHTTYRADGTIAAVDEIVISSSESSASAVIAAQADAIGNLAGAIAAGAGP
jgi:hypothetical protein